MTTKTRGEKRKREKKDLEVGRKETFHPLYLREPPPRIERKKDESEYSRGTREENAEGSRDFKEERLSSSPGEKERIICGIVLKTEDRAEERDVLVDK